MITELKAKALLAHKTIEQLQADSKTLIKQWNTALRSGEDDKSVTAIELAQTLNKREIVRAIARAEVADMEVRKEEAQAEAIAAKKADDEFIEADCETRNIIAEIDEAALIYIAAVEKLGNEDQSHIRERTRQKVKEIGTLSRPEPLLIPNFEIFGAVRKASAIVEFLNKRALLY